MVGFSDAGKNTIMTQSKVCKIQTSHPISDFVLKTVEYRDMTFRIFNLEGPDVVRNQWKQLYNPKDAIVFVVNPNDRDCIEEARREFDKISLLNAMGAAEVTDKLGLYSLRQRAWYIQSTCAPSSDDLYEDFERLANSLGNAGHH